MKRYGSARVPGDAAWVHNLPDATPSVIAASVIFAADAVEKAERALVDARTALLQRKSMYRRAVTELPSHIMRSGLWTEEEVAEALAAGRPEGLE